MNLYPEINPKDSPVPVTHYQRPGLRPLVTGEVAPVRQVYRASNGTGYCCIGQSVYQISDDWTLVRTGTLELPRTTPVSMIDNGTTLVVVDGTNIGYQAPLNGGGDCLVRIVDPTGTFSGADRVDTIDTFVIGNTPGTNEFFSTLSNEIAFTDLYFGAKSDYPDPIQSVIVNRHEILLIGQLKSEIWYDAGNAQFPFAELPGAYIEHGTCAKYSVASEDINVYWLGQDLQGQGVVFRQRGYECKRISNHALEFQIEKMALAGTVTDAIGYTYQQGGHVFYVLSFPTGNQTWVYDAATEMWHQRSWTDANGQLGRDRTNCGANIYGLNVVGDWQNGTLYAQDPRVYTDTVADVVSPISWIRSFPHITAADQNGQLVETNGKRITINRVEADLDCGNTPQQDSPVAIGLRISLDRGKTWQETVLQSAGELGQYATFPQWLRASGVCRDPVIELSYSYAGQASLNGCWADVVLNNT